jgi:hypothetical protein
MASLLIRKLEERHRWLILVRQHLCAETPAGSKQRVMRWWSYERAAHFTSSISLCTETAIDPSLDCAAVGRAISRAAQPRQSPLIVPEREEGLPNRRKTLTASYRDRHAAAAEVHLHPSMHLLVLVDF